MPKEQKALARIHIQAPVIGNLTFRTDGTRNPRNNHHWILTRHLRSAICRNKSCKTEAEIHVKQWKPQKIAGYSMFQENIDWKLGAPTYTETQREKEGRKFAESLWFSLPKVYSEIKEKSSDSVNILKCR